MKRIIILSVVALILWFFLANESDTPKPVDSKEEAALSAIKAEEKVIDAVINDANVLYAYVQDSSGNRDGYAAYLCELASESGIRLSRVTLVRYGSQNSPEKDNAFGVTVGKASCY